jgi:hypothetical protein
MVRTEERKYKNKNEEREDRNEERKSLSKTWVRRTVPSTPSSWWEERKKIVQPSPQDQEDSKGISQAGARRTVSTTPSSWWEDRKKIELPDPQDQEKSYRGEQERYKQEISESEKQRRAEVEEKNKTWARINVPSTPSSWWEDRKKIEQPNPQDQEKRYREEQERYKQERDESEKQMRVESEEKKDTSKITSETYEEFYSEWVKTLRNSFGRFCQIPTMESNKETFEKFLVSAEESNKIYSSWIAELEENSRATREVLQGEPDPAKYKEVYDMWIKSYGKMLTEFHKLPLRQNMTDIFENITGIPDIYSETFEQVSNLWKDSYAKLYVPNIDSMLKLSLKSAEFFRGNASPEACTEFHTLWMNTYQETFGRLFDYKSMRPSKEVLEYFERSENINLNLFKSWIAALEKMSQRAEELSKQSAGPEINKYFYNPWAKIYADTFNSMSNIWVKSYNTLTETV